MKKLHIDSILTDIEPLPWTLINSHPNTSIIGKHTLLLGRVRWNYILSFAKKYINKNTSVLDMGIFPGCAPHLFNAANIEWYKYYGFGLGFTELFKETMHNLQVDLFDVDLDIHFVNSNRKFVPSTLSIDSSSVDVVLFTDVIEHFFNPMHALSELNRVLKLDSHLLLTTDNISRLSSIKQLIVGRSCNVPLIEGNFFYSGNWRPHFREYSKDELFKMLEWSGFEIISHNFYESYFGHFSLSDDKKIIRSMKPSIKMMAKKMLLTFFPSMRDNHIIIARKRSDIDELIGKVPTLTSSDIAWHQMRSKFK